MPLLDAQKSFPRDLWCIYQPCADVSDSSDLYHCVLSLGSDPLLLILKAGQMNRDQLQPTWGRTALWWPRLYLQLPDGSDPGQWAAQLLPGSATRPPLTAYRNPCSPSRVLNANPLSTVISHNHGCRTQKKQSNQAPGIPHYHNHTIKASPRHILFPLPVWSAFTWSLSVTAFPYRSSQVAVRGMSEEMR